MFCFYYAFVYYHVFFAIVQVVYCEHASEMAELDRWDVRLCWLSFWLNQKFSAFMSCLYFWKHCYFWVVEVIVYLINLLTFVQLHGLPAPECHYWFSFNVAICPGSQLSCCFCADCRVMWMLLWSFLQFCIVLYLKNVTSTSRSENSRLW